MLDNIFEVGTALEISMTKALISMGISLALGLIISLIYIVTERKRRYSANFAITLVLLPALVAFIIMLVGNNIARAFSIAGVFALVRFRSVPGNSKDISHVLFAMGIGLATGMGFVTFAAVVTVIINLIYFLLMVTNYGVIKNAEHTLRIMIPENLNYQVDFSDIFEKYTEWIDLDRIRTRNMGSMYELTYRIVLKKNINEKSLIDELRSKNGNLSIILYKTENENIL